MFKAMLAKDGDPSAITYPVVAQVKLDGIRASVVDGVLVSRTLKPIKNAEIQAALGRAEYNGLDGELIVGAPEAEGCMQRTSSFVMSESKTGADWTYYVFDKWDAGVPAYRERWMQASETFMVADEDTPHMKMLGYSVCRTEDQLVDFEQRMVAGGHEGVIVRDPVAPYKFGRSGKKGPLLKIKRFEDSEAIILGVYEEQHNANEKVTNALGRSERSSHKAGKIGKGTLGGFEVRDVHTGVEFRVGSGFTAQQRADFWEAAEHAIGDIIKYKSFAIGVKEKPRHPVFLGFRDLDDFTVGA